MTNLITIIRTTSIILAGVFALVARMPKHNNHSPLPVRSRRLRGANTSPVQGIA